MKRLTLLLLLTIFPFALNAAAQNNVPRVDAARGAIDQTREYRGDREFGQDREWGRENARAGYEIDRLNQEVRELRYDVRNTRSYHVHARFESLERETDRLTALYRQHRLRSSEVRRRAMELRRDASHLRTMLHLGWR